MDKNISVDAEKLSQAMHDFKRIRWNIHKIIKEMTRALQEIDEAINIDEQ